MRARWIRRLLWVLGFGCLWLPVCDDPPLQTGSYLQDVRGDRATVAMITAGPEQLRCEVRGATGELVAELRSAAPARRHAFVAQGLQPGATYDYAVLDAVGRGRVGGRFATARADDAAPVRFAFLGDSGAVPAWVWLQTAPIGYLPAHWQWLPTRGEVTAIGARLAAFAPQFVLHLGDVIYPNGRHAHYSAGFFRPFADVLRQAPIYPLLGNHDVMDADGLQLLANFHLPGSVATGDERQFSFAHGAVRVICADLNTDYGAVPFGPEHPGYRFVATELASATEPWVVVASHFPMRSASRQRDRGDLLLHLQPLLERWGVDLYLSGHDHCYQRYGHPEQGELVQITSGGGGKSLYAVRPHAKAVVLASQFHWCSAVAADGQLLVKAHAQGGDLLDSVQLPLRSGGSLERLREQNPARATRIEALLRPR